MTLAVQPNLPNEKRRKAIQNEHADRKQTSALARALKLPTVGDVKSTPLACEPKAT
jgi:hypothetical protein